MKDATKWLLGIGAVALVAGVAGSSMPWPVPFAGVTAPFGELRTDGTTHNGVDLRAPLGTPVRAPRAGSVVDVGYDARAGYFLVVWLSNGLRAGFAHLHSMPDLFTGEVFEQGATLAYTGETGNARGPHLHYTLKRGDTWLDPEKHSA